jgi:membrane protein required for colicin V production
MNALDYAVIAVMLISIVIGVLRGAVRELMNIAGWVLAFVLAYVYAPSLAAQFADWAAEPVLRLVAAWIAIFLMVLLGVAVITSLVSGLVKQLGLGGLDRGVGALIGVARGFAVLLALTLAAGFTTIPQTSLWREAASTPWLEIAALYSRTMIPEGISAKLQYRTRSEQKARSADASSFVVRRTEPCAA